MGRLLKFPKLSWRFRYAVDRAALISLVDPVKQAPEQAAWLFKKHLDLPIGLLFGLIFPNAPEDNQVFTGKPASRTRKGSFLAQEPSILIYIFSECSGGCPENLSDLS